MLHTVYTTTLTYVILHNKLRKIIVRNILMGFLNVYKYNLHDFLFQVVQSAYSYLTLLRQVYAGP
jgi:hypothetical protein